ncbi:lipoprotein [Mycoplasma mycoides]|uniref:lipoprotein n=1 Tax=Mycoplasma mycoides TaxID=2102 RepID=UPI002240AC2D|nr:lipoprotein [Mycoplasma mycoides]
MKKLLTLLGSFALIASSAAITVACKTPSQEIKAAESDKAKKGEKTKEEKKVKPVVTTTTAKKQVKAKSDAEIASELTRELFLLMDDSNSKSKENKPTSSPEDILKKQKEKAERSVSLGTGSRRVGNSSNNVVNDWLKNFSSPKK